MSPADRDVRDVRDVRDAMAAALHEALEALQDGQLTPDQLALRLRTMLETMTQTLRLHLDAAMAIAMTSDLTLA